MNTSASRPSPSSAIPRFVLGNESFESSDHEQSKLRIALSAFAVLWSATHPLELAAADGFLESHFLVAVTYLTLSLVIFVLWTIVHKSLSTRASFLRNLCLAGDISAISIYTAVSDAASTILLPIYLSAIIGYGMRFGHRYLLAALTLSVCEFLFVAQENKYLYTNPTIVLTYLFSMFFVPIYTILLLKKYALILEAYMAASRQKEEFIAIMSHEFRAPLHSIVSIAELCQSHLRAGNNDKANSNLLAIRVKDILRCSERMLGVANRIAAQQMCTTTPTESEASSYNTYRDVFLAVRICDIYAKRKHFPLYWEIAGNTPPITTLDSSVAQEILINLLDNAIKHTTTGCVQLTVRFAKSSESGGILEIVVADTGVGIAAPHARSPGILANRSDSLINRKSAGLGLAITRRHVELLGGTIQCVATVPNGTLVSVNLPLSIPSKATIATSHWRRILILATRPLNRKEENLLIACKLFPRYAFGSAERVDRVHESFGHLSATLSDQEQYGDTSIGVLSSCDLSAIPNVFFVTSPASGELVRSAHPNFVINVNDPLVAIVQLNAFRLLAHEILLPHADEYHVISGRAVVLLVDDSEITTEATQRVMENAGFTCLVAHSIDEAAAILLTTEIDVIVADLYVGDENLLDFLGSAREKLLSSIPIICVTAESDRRITKAALEMGVFEVLIKPVSGSRLLEGIYRIQANCLGEDSRRRQSRNYDEIVDWQVLDEVFESTLDYAAFEILVRRFQDDLMGNAIRALGLINGKQFLSLWRLFHKMAGVSMLFGARQLAERLSSWSHYARTMAFSDIALVEIEDIDLLIAEFVSASTTRYKPKP